jgi:large subunit ribosomal protein L35
MKTHKATAKRVKRTGSGGFRHYHAYGSHILTKKSSRRKRGYRQSTLAHESNENALKTMLPYS